MESEELCCISHAFHRAASRNPSRLAVVHSSSPAAACSSQERLQRSPPVYPGDECFTCADLLAAVASLSCRITVALNGHDEEIQGTLGCSNRTEDAAIIGSEKRRVPRIVGVYVSPSVEYIVAALAVLRCGEAFLPLDPLWPEERIRSVISSSNASLIIRGRTFMRLEGAEGSMSTCPVVLVDMRALVEGTIGLTDLVLPCECKRPQKFCYVMYTSGSTGKPKGVCGTEKGLLNRFSWMQRRNPVSPDDVLLFKTSISFVDHLQEFLSAILTCTTLVIPPPDDWKANPASLVNLIEAYGISRMTLVPSLMEIMLSTLGNYVSHGYNPLKVLIFSGEVLSISLWKRVHQIIPETTILNLYGTTEVSGDCTFFDCKDLPRILEWETLTNVPIGVPISNCEVCLVTEIGRADEGEIYVGGACLFTGYLAVSTERNPTEVNESPLFYKTGDFARRLESGELIFLGRKDRIIKINGQRTSLEEVEATLTEHPEISDAAVTFHQSNGPPHLKAYLVLKNSDELEEDNKQCSEENSSEDITTSIRSWLVMKLPPAMIPSYFFSIKSLPTTSSGKIDYVKLLSLEYSLEWHKSESKSSPTDPRLQIIIKAFRDTLHVEEVSEFDDFFTMGGNSISAAHVAHKLGIDMRLLYIYPSPSKLLHAFLAKCSRVVSPINDPHSRKKLKVSSSILSSLSPASVKSRDAILPQDTSQINSESAHDHSLENDVNETVGQLEKNVASPNGGSQEKDLYSGTASNDGNIISDTPWIPSFCLRQKWSVGRCNKFMHESEEKLHYANVCSYQISNTKRGYMQELWNVFLESCVDASPLLVSMDGKLNLFIGSHSHLFLCIDAFSGSVRWNIKLEGRIECSAAITGDFFEVVVGCYKGKIYFLDMMTGKLSWTFQTGGEVKMQPVVDNRRNLIWCGSYDHYLYALNYKEHSCFYKVTCGGSIYGSPAIDMAHNMIYVASTSGCVTAISLEVPTFRTVWQYDAGSPIFGSLTMDHQSGNVICCLVSGAVIVLNSHGSVIWKAIVGGPIFAGACISSALPSQVLVSSRDGSLYSFDVKKGAFLWVYQVGDPITASAFVDEQTLLISKPLQSSERFACLCTSSGKVHVIRIRADAKQEKVDQSVPNEKLVQGFAVIDLPGDIFSSPVMVGGHIFVGCRDDHLHCVTVTI